MQSKQKFALQRFRVLKPRPRVTPIVLFLKSCCCVREKNIFLSYLRQIMSWKILQRCYPPNPPKKTHTHTRRISLTLSPRQLSFYTIHGPKSNALHFSRKEINMSVAPIRACILTLTSGTSVMYFVEKALVDVFILAYFANQNCWVMVT